MEGVIEFFGRLTSLFGDRSKQLEADVKTARKAQAEINRRIDSLEKVIRAAEMNGEERWFLCTKRGEKR